MVISEKEFFVPVNKAKLFCRTFGKVQPPIIVLHGGPGLGLHYLLPQMAELGTFSFAIFYDQRGTGESTDDNNEWQLNPFQTYVNDVDELRIALGLEKVTLLAHSWGGILASMYALAYPQQVNKIIYLNSVPLSTACYTEFVAHRTQIVDTHKDELLSIRESLKFAEGDTDTVEKYYLLYFKNYFSHPGFEKKLSLKMSPKAAINNFKIYDLFYQYSLKHPFDLYDKLKVLNKQSLIVACDKDVIPLHYMEHLHHNIPSSKLVLIKNSGHFPYIDQPKTLFSAIQDFVM